MERYFHVMDESTKVRNFPISDQYGNNCGGIPLIRTYKGAQFLCEDMEGLQIELKRCFIEANASFQSQRYPDEAQAVRLYQGLS